MLKNYTVQNVLNNSSDVILFISEEGDIIWANKIGLELFESENIAFTDTMLEDDIPEFEQLLTKVKQPNNTNELFSCRHQLESGITISLKWSLGWDSDKRYIICLAAGGTKSIVEEKLKYHYIFQKDPSPKIKYDSKTLKIIDLNDAAISVYGYSKEEFLDMTVKDIFVEDSVFDFLKGQRGLSEKHFPYHLGVFTHHHKDGTNLIMDVSGGMSSSIEESMMLYCVDITESHKTLQFERLERRIMEQAMELAPDLNKILENYVLGLEQIFPDMKASILSVKDNKIYNLACPNLPQIYKQAIEGATIGPKGGSCGTAAFLKKRVIVSDISTDPLWEDYKALALPVGLAACWSQPIFNSEKKVIATFANYYATPRKPTHKELLFFERSSSLVSIILENYRNSMAIRSRNQLYKYVHQATNDAIFDWDFINDNIKWGQSFQRLFGHALTSDFYPLAKWQALVHPDDLQNTMQALNEFLKNPYSDRWTGQYRFRKADFKYVYVETMVYAIRDIEGNPVRLIGVFTDITEKLKYVKTVEEQNTRLREIAWDQSHSVRVPVARLMGLIDLIKNGNIPMAEKEDLLTDVLDSAQEVDKVIKCISLKTNSHKETEEIAKLLQGNKLLNFQADN